MIFWIHFLGGQFGTWAVISPVHTIVASTKMPRFTILRQINSFVLSACTIFSSFKLISHLKVEFVYSRRYKNVDLSSGGFAP